MRKIIFVGNDIELKSELERTSRELDVMMLSVEESISYGESDILVISDHVVNVMSLDAFIPKIKAEKVFYLISNAPKASVIENQIALVKKLDIVPIIPRTSIKSIVRKVLGLEEESSALTNVIGFLGTHAQVGVTSIVSSVASQLSERNLEVCVLGLNQYNSGLTWFSKYEGNTFDEMYEQLVDNQSGISVEQLNKYMHHDEIRKFKYLAGNKDLTKLNYFGADEIDQLILTAARSYDVVLLDLGSNPTNYQTIKGLERSGSKFVVANQLQLSTQQWQQMHADIFRLLQLTKEEFLMILNRFSYDLPRDKNMMSAEMSVPTIAVIPDYQSEGMVCESEYKLLTESSTKSVRRDSTNHIAEITKAISSRLNLFATQTKEKKGWIFAK